MSKCSSSPCNFLRDSSYKICLKESHKPQPQTYVLIKWQSLTYLSCGCAFWKSPRPCVWVSAYLSIYRLWLLPTASITPSHHRNSCLLSMSLCSSWGRGEECETAFNSLGSGWRERGEGVGGLVNRTSGSHLDQRKAYGSGTGRRLSMPRRKWKVVCMCVFICVLCNACLIIATIIIPAALWALLYCL